MRALPRCNAHADRQLNVQRKLLAEILTDTHPQLFCKGGADRLLDSASDPDFNEESTILSGAMKAMRNEFEETTWQAFWRATVDEQPYDLIAEALGISRQAVRQAKYRVLRRLRQEMGDSAGK